MRRALLVALSAAVAAGGVGCAGGAAVVEPGPAVEVTSAAQIDLPLVKYLKTLDEEKLITAAMMRRQVVCAQRFGVRVEPTNINDVDFAAGLVVGRRYGLVDLAEAEKYAYAGKPSAGSDDEKPTRITKEMTLRGEVMSGHDANGNPSKLRDKDGNLLLTDGGCGRIGWDEVRGDVSFDWDAPAQDLLNEATNRLKVHPEYLAAEKDWAACMSEAGYSFKKTFDAGNSVAGKGFKKERAMAVLDVKCKQKVNFPGRAMAVDVAIQNQLIQENEGSLRGLLEMKRELMQRAKDALK